MWIRIEGKGVSLAIFVKDEIDTEIVRLAITLSEKRRDKNPINATD